MLNRKNNLTIKEIKEEIEKLKGKRINMSVNQGRKRYANFEGVIQDTYNSIFVVKLTAERKDFALNELKEMFENDLKHKEDDVSCLPDTPIEINHPEPIDLRTYSYTDILCGNVNIKNNSVLSQGEQI